MERELAYAMASGIILSMTSQKTIEKAYTLACEPYARYGVDVKQALKQLSAISISLHCWQGDDVRGFENRDQSIEGSGLQTTGHYPGAARSGDELRADLEKALSLIPGRHRVNLHAIYAETGGRKVERNELQPSHFSAWIDWAADRKLGLDLNGTFFSHPKASSGFTLSSRGPGIRKFWVEHAMAIRHIGAAMGKKLCTPCIANIWIPDGFKDIPADRKTPRELLGRSLNEIFSEKINTVYLLDALEGKLFGIGSESYVVGSHEFYLAYAAVHNKLLCLDTGHFHPTESVADKISSILCVLDRILLHVSRGIRWDSDHVAILSDELKALAEEIVRGRYLNRVHFSLDYFDASINRIAAWVIGSRSWIKALLLALLEPSGLLRTYEKEGDYTSRLAMIEELKSLPFGSIWNYYCWQQDAPMDNEWLKDVKQYERKVQSLR